MQKVFEKMSQSKDKPIEEAVATILSSSKFLELKLEYSMDEETKNCLKRIEESTKTILAISDKQAKSKYRYSITKSSNSLNKEDQTKNLFSF